MVRRAVFLDRDGVINRNVEHSGRPAAPTALADFQLLPGVQSALRRIKVAGFLVVVVTNQPDVAAGRLSKEAVAAMHALIRRHLSVDDIRVCFHRDGDNCSCRKPKPGMILEAAAEHHVDLASSFMVGDRWRDIEAGRAAGCTTICVGHNSGAVVSSDAVVDSLCEAVSFILHRQVHN